jgi:hypothetical protein
MPIQSDKKSKVKDEILNNIGDDVRSLLPAPDYPNTNIIISEDPATMQFLIQRAANKRQQEQEAKLQAKRAEEEQRENEEYENNG